MYRNDLANILLSEILSFFSNFNVRQNMPKPALHFCDFVLHKRIFGFKKIVLLFRVSPQIVELVNFGDELPPAKSEGDSSSFWRVRQNPLRSFDLVRFALQKRKNRTTVRSFVALSFVADYVGKSS